MLCEGLNFQEIGKRLFIEKSTVKNHCNKIYRKLHVQSKTEAVTKALIKGIIPPNDAIRILYDW